MKFLIFAIWFCFLSKATYGQYASRTSLIQSFQSHKSSNTTTLDSLDQLRKRRLLPKNISLWEGVYWGESGLFRIVGVAPLTVESRKAELSVRRTMLTLHQISGFATLGLMIATIIIGEQYIANYDTDLYDKKRALGNATVLAYMTTAAFSLFSPPPSIRRDEWNSVSTHKLLALIHFAGMIATPILASRISGGDSFQDRQDRTTIHQRAAYLTTAAFAASIFVIYF